MSTFLDLEWSSGYIIESIKAKCRVSYVICYLSWRKGRKVKNIYGKGQCTVCVCIYWDYITKGNTRRINKNGFLEQMKIDGGYVWIGLEVRLLGMYHFIQFWLLTYKCKELNWKKNEIEKRLKKLFDVQGKTIVKNWEKPALQ